MITKLFNKLSQGKISAEPCLPGPFGYRMAWYAIKGETPQVVMQKLGLAEVQPANWETGIGYAYNNDGGIFVSPEVNGYVLVIGLPFNAELARKHGALFTELQYFSSDSVRDNYAWAKFINGELVRAHSICCDTVETVSEGKVTGEELTAGFEGLPTAVAGGFEGEREFACEQAVLQIAKAWGVDPLFADEEQYDKSAGWVCRFKG